MNKRRFGGRAELAAGRYLEARGYAVLAYNYRTRRGEIDLIARDGESVVFIEVKCRTDARFGAPEEAVDARKRRQLLRLAEEYLQGRDVACRFDVVAVRVDRRRPQVCRVRLIRDAFGQD